MSIVYPNLNVTVKLWDHRGRLVHKEVGHNLVVNTGLNIIRDCLYGDVKPLTYFALGTSNASVTAAQTALLGEVYRSTITAKTKFASKLTCTFYLSSAAANGNTLREAGLFDSTGSNVTGMYARYVLGTGIVKTSANSATFTWELTWS